MKKKNRKRKYRRVKYNSILYKIALVIRHLPSTDFIILILLAGYIAWFVLQFIGVIYGIYTMMIFLGLCFAWPLIFIYDSIYDSYRPMIELKEKLMHKPKVPILPNQDAIEKYFSDLPVHDVFFNAHLLDSNVVEIIVTNKKSKVIKKEKISLDFFLNNFIDDTDVLIRLYQSY